ncbi:hypothetical protein Plhal304r1_c073g0161301 [Plasmopara halstedii]
MLIAGSIILLICSTSAYNSTRSGFSFQTAAGVPDHGVLVAVSSSSIQNLSSFHKTTDKDVEERANGPLLGKMSDAVHALVERTVPADSTLTPEMEGLVDLCAKHNRDAKHKNRLSPVAPLLERFSDKDVDNSEAIRNGKFDELLWYTVSHSRKKRKGSYSWDVLLRILTTHFDGDGNLVQQINEAKRHLGLNAIDIVQSLKAQLLHRWRKSSPKSVWRRLQFGPDTYNALTSGKLEMFHEYTAKFFPSRNHLAIEKFLSTYEVVDVTEALAKARMEPHSKEIASTMCHERLNYWIANSYKLREVFDLLKFDNADSLYSALYKLETLTDFIWSSFDNSTPMRVTLHYCSAMASAALEENNSIAFHLPAAGLRSVLFEVWTSDRISFEELLDRLRIVSYTDIDGNVHIDEGTFDRDVSSIPFDGIPRRS